MAGPFGYISLANASSRCLPAQGVGSKGLGSSGREGLGKGDVLLGRMLKAGVEGSLMSLSLVPHLQPHSLVLCPLGSPSPKPPGLPCSRCSIGRKQQHALAADGPGLSGQGEGRACPARARETLLCSPDPWPPSPALPWGLRHHMNITL